MSLLLGQLTHKPETLEGYILTSGWLFFGFILAASYTAELASFLTDQRESALVRQLAGDNMKKGTGNSCENEIFPLVTRFHFGNGVRLTSYVVVAYTVVPVKGAC